MEAMSEESSDMTAELPAQTSEIHLSAPVLQRCAYEKTENLLRPTRQFTIVGILPVAQTNTVPMGSTRLGDPDCDLT